MLSFIHAPPVALNASGLKRTWSYASQSLSPKRQHKLSSASAAQQSPGDQVGDRDAAACFQLLHVRGIPDWANRCACHGQVCQCLDSHHVV